MDKIQFLHNLKKYGEENDIPNISFTNANFLQDLIKLQNSQNVLEIGTANGFSTIVMAYALEKTGGKITTIEFSENSINQAKINAENAGVGNIDFRWGNALDIIPTFENESFDFIFIDGMMRRYKDFLELSLLKAKSSACIILDDVIKFEHKMAGFYDFINENKIRYNVLPIDPDDGIMMIIKD